MERQPGKLETALALISMALVCWVTIPPQERLWLRIRAAELAQAAALRAAGAAWRRGHEGMGLELAGEPGAVVRYGEALWLSAARDSLERFMRIVKP